MAAAHRIVEAGGLSALTARKVADQIGYSPGTLYNLFENLDDMIIHLNGRTLTRMAQSLADCPVSGDPLNDLTVLVDRYVKFLKEHRNLWAAVFEHRLPEGQAVPNWYQDQVSGALSIVETRVNPLFTADLTAEKQVAARTLWAGVHGICTLSESGKLEIVAPEPTELMAHTLVRNFVVGLAHRDDGPASPARS